MKKFLLGLACGLVFALLVGVVLIFAIAKFASSTEETVNAESLLMMRLAGPIGEKPAEEFSLPWLDAQNPITILEIREMLDRAAQDNKIKGVFLDLGQLSAGWAKVEEIRERLEIFKKSGKPVYAFLRTPGSKEYLLATVADRISMVEEDYLDLKGLRAERMFFKNTLDKVGVEMEIIHAGKFKDFGDSYTKTAMSAESKEALNGILDGIYATLVEGIAKGRKRDAAAVKKLIDEGPYLAKAAKQAGLVDELEYENVTIEALAKKANVSSRSRTSLRSYRKQVRRGWERERENRVAYLVAEGDILRGSGGGFGDEGIIASRSFISDVEALKQDDSYKGVVLRIDSPGGDAIASDELLAAVKSLSEKKPTVISFSDVAASGGYYMAVTGDEITAYPSTITGSIGVVYGKPNVKGLYQKLGLTKDYLKRGANADIDLEDQPLSEIGRRKLREGVDESYRTFLARVAIGRKAKVEEIAPLAEGRAWVARDPQAKRLTDQLTGLSGAVEALRKKMRVDAATKMYLHPYPSPDSAWRKWFSEGDLNAASPDALLRRAFPMSYEQKQLETLRKALRPALVEGGMMRRMLYTIEVK